jgi:hypothetical protein
MLSDFTFNKTLSEPMAECKVYESRVSQEEIDCYPYAIRGVLFGLLFASILWGAILGALMLVL